MKKIIILAVMLGAPCSSVWADGLADFLNEVASVTVALLADNMCCGCEQPIVGEQFQSKMGCTHKFHTRCYNQYTICQGCRAEKIAVREGELRNRIAALEQRISAPQFQPQVQPQVQGAPENRPVFSGNYPAPLMISDAIALQFLELEKRKFEAEQAAVAANLCVHCEKPYGKRPDGSPLEDPKEDTKIMGCCGAKVHTQCLRVRSKSTNKCPNKKCNQSFWIGHYQ